MRCRAGRGEGTGRGERGSGRDGVPRERQRGNQRERQKEKQESGEKGKGGRKEGSAAQAPSTKPGRGRPPPPPTAGSGTGSQRGARARKPGCQVSAAPAGEWLQSASSAEAGFPVLWSFPETAVRLCVATGCPDVVSCHVEVSAVTPTSQVGKTEAQKCLTAAVGDRDSTRVCLAPGPMLGYPQEQDITLSVTKCFPFSL